MRPSIYARKPRILSKLFSMLENKFCNPKFLFLKKGVKMIPELWGRYHISFQTKIHTSLVPKLTWLYYFCPYVIFSVQNVILGEMASHMACWLIYPLIINLMWHFVFIKKNLIKILKHKKVFLTLYSSKLKTQISDLKLFLLSNVDNKSESYIHPLHWTLVFWENPFLRSCWILPHAT